MTDAEKVLRFAEEHLAWHGSRICDVCRYARMLKVAVEALEMDDHTQSTRDALRLMAEIAEGK